MWPKNKKDVIDKRIFLLPTDTVYGLHARALCKSDVERLRLLKKRDKNKPFIVLLKDVNELEKFGVNLNKRLENFLNKIWPGPYSVLLPVSDEFNYIGAKGKIAFRVPSRPELLDFLAFVGPLVSSSANISGEPTLQSVSEAKRVFGKQVDLYIDEGELNTEPSVLLDILRF